MPSSDAPCFADLLIDTRLIERLAGDIVWLFSPEKISALRDRPRGNPLKDGLVSKHFESGVKRSAVRTLRRLLAPSSVEHNVRFAHHVAK